jgi:prepilin-type N-terminal cleavage/methylation domain-containing protein
MNLKNNKNLVFADRRGFTLIEVLLVMLIIGILSGVIFVSVGNQRQKAKLSTVLKTAKGNHAISQECYFREGEVDLPNSPKNPTNEICEHSRTTWMPITVDECEYQTGATSDEYYFIDCPTFSKQIRCGIRASGECEEILIP